MAKGSTKKPGPAKCRGSSALIEGREWVRIGGNKWLKEVAEQKGKFIPLEYRKDAPKRTKKAEKAEETPAAEVAVPPVEAPPGNEEVNEEIRESIGE